MVYERREEAPGPSGITPEELARANGGPPPAAIVTVASTPAGPSADFAAPRSPHLRLIDIALRLA